MTEKLSLSCCKWLSTQFNKNSGCSCLVVHFMCTHGKIVNKTKKHNLRCTLMPF